MAPTPRALLCFARGRGVTAASWRSPRANPSCNSRKHTGRPSPWPIIDSKEASSEVSVAWPRPVLKLRACKAKRLEGGVAKAYHWATSNGDPGEGQVCVKPAAKLGHRMGAPLVQVAGVRPPHTTPLASFHVVVPSAPIDKLYGGGVVAQKEVYVLVVVHFNNAGWQA